MAIRKRGDSFEITVSCGTDSQGKKIRKTMTFKPKRFNEKNGKPRTEPAIMKEVEAAAREFERKVKNPSLVEESKMFFSDLVDNEWMPKWAKFNLSIRCQEDYHSKIERLFFPDLGKTRLNKIRVVDIQNILNREAEKGKSKETIKRDLTAIKSVFKYAYRMQMIESNPCDRVEAVGKSKNKEVECFTPEQARRFISALDIAIDDKYTAHMAPRHGKNVKIRDYIIHHTVSSMWKLYFVLAIAKGMRRGEMCALKWSDIDLQKRTIHVRRAVSKTKQGIILKEPKTEKSTRDITYPEFCDVFFKTWYEEEKKIFEILGEKWQGDKKAFDENHLFIQKTGKMVHITTPSNKFKEIISRYNSTVEENEQLPMIKLHALRHTCASILIANDIDIVTVSKLLGHSNITTTLNVYTHSINKDDSLASEAMNDILSIK